MTDTTYHKDTGADSRTFLPELAQLFVDSFSEPPYEVEVPSRSRFKKWFTDEIDSPGFTLVRAINAGNLVGMAYGFTMLPGQWWPNSLDESESKLTQATKFAVIEWGVLPTVRRSGIGRTLMISLLSGRPEPYATLLVNPRAQAHSIYQRWGWAPVGQVRTVHDPMTIMVLALPAQ